MELRDFCILLADRAATIFAGIPRATPAPGETISTHHKAVTFVVGDDVSRVTAEAIAALVQCMHGGMHGPQRLVDLVPFTRGHADDLFVMVDRRPLGLQVCVAMAGLPRVELAVAFRQGRTEPMTHAIKDPALYRRMSEPHESQEAANVVLDAFFADLRAIREKHRIRDVVCAVAMCYRTDVAPAGETVAEAHLTIGSTSEAVGMAAVLYGSLRADWQAAMDTATRMKPQKEPK